MAIRSDEIVNIIKSAIDTFDAEAETRNVGTVVEVGDGIAQIYGLEAPSPPSCSSSRAASWAWPSTSRRRPSARSSSATPRRSRRATRSRRRAASSRSRSARRSSAASSTRSASRSTTRARSDDQDPPRRAHRPGRHRSPVGRHAGPDGHQGHRCPHPDRPRPARADHRRPPDRQDRDRDRHDHQPEGPGARLHLRRDRPEARRSQNGRDAREVRRHGAHDRRRRRRRGPAPLQYLAPYSGAAFGEEIMEVGVEVNGGSSRTPVRLRRPVEARVGVPRDGPAAAPAGPRGLPGRRLLPPLPAARAGRA